MIEVRVFATFREGREKVIFLPSSEFRIAEDIISHLNINIEDVAILLINGRHSKPNDAVKEGDIVSLFPPVGGG